MRDGGPNVVTVWVHPDPRCQAVLEQVREVEITQAIDRVRPVFNRRRIIVLTNVALDLTVDHAWTWPQLRPGKFVNALARHVVLPLSAGDLCRGFPDLWADPKSAEEALRWIAKKIPVCSQIDSLFGITRVFFPKLIKAAYRRKGQRGRQARALIRADLPDHRAALEGLVGELTEFHVDPHPDGSQSSNGTAEQTPPKPSQAPWSLPPLRPLAAAISAESHLLATMAPDERPPDMLGMARVMKLVALTAEHDATRRLRRCERGFSVPGTRV
jgi:hypothetical protein